jgi:hypothetical protein
MAYEQRGERNYGGQGGGGGGDGGYDGGGGNFGRGRGKREFVLSCSKVEIITTSSIPSMRVLALSMFDL